MKEEIKYGMEFSQIGLGETPKQNIMKIVREDHIVNTTLQSEKKYIKANVLTYVFRFGLVFQY